MIDYGFFEDLTHIIGIDEAGWGAIAGPVYVGGCVVDITDNLEWLDIKDSKRYTTERAREIAYINLQRAQSEGRLEYFSWELPSDFVSQNPSHALALGQRVVVEVLLGDGESPDKKAGVLVDGNVTPKFNVPTNAVPKADSLYKVVSAASVVAKVERDKVLSSIMSVKFPDYEFDKNKGYPTQRHLEVLNKLGPCLEHRRNIKRVQDARKIQ